MLKIAFTNGPVFVGDGQILDSALVVVEDDRITRVESGDATPAVRRKASRS
jgi:imidazolonepropionase-like amidohydrolase